MLNGPGSTQRGVSILELMIGVAVGLTVVVGALTLTVRNITNSRSLMVETRLNQDLRAAADLLARDVRRAGYWGNAIQATTAIGAGSATARNPYSAASGTTADGLAYNFSRDSVENDSLNTAEQFGFRLNAGAVQMQTASGTWQDVTDAKSVVVTALDITPTQTALPLGQLCLTSCAPGVANCPTVTVRSFTVTLSARAFSDPSLTRTQSINVRLRNEEVLGQCPA